MKAIQLQAFGDPSNVVKLVDVPDIGAPGPDEIVIAVEASPINRTDFLIIAGLYGYLPPLPSILGAEGVGRVIAAGRASSARQSGLRGDISRCVENPRHSRGLRWRIRVSGR
jgi:NADPH:quinone reductase-like Zn-dependent oxidoreductase